LPPLWTWEGHGTAHTGGVSSVGHAAPYPQKRSGGGPFAAGLGQMVGSEEAWSAFSSFCEAVMLQKEEAERVRCNEAEAAAESDRGTDGKEEDRPSSPDSWPLARTLQGGASPPVRRR